MRLFRCYPRVPGARTGKPGHWSYLPRPQLHGRWDNAELYDSWYFSRSAVGAVAESFYSKRQWIPEVFLTAEGRPRAIAEFELHETDTRRAELVDLDDAATLLRLGLAPSQVVVPNLRVTQDIGRDIFLSESGEHVGVSWWSSQLPSETSVLLWGEGGAPPPGLRLVGIQSLSVEHPAVIEAASRLYRVLG